MEDAYLRQRAAAAVASSRARGGGRRRRGVAVFGSRRRQQQRRQQAAAAAARRHEGLVSRWTRLAPSACGVCPRGARFASPSALLRGASRHQRSGREGGAAAAVGEAFEASDEAAAAGVAELASAVVGRILTRGGAPPAALPVHDHRAGAASAPQGTQGARRRRGRGGASLYRPFLPASLAAEAASFARGRRRHG